jgi:hypothetical protein
MIKRMVHLFSPWQSINQTLETVLLILCKHVKQSKALVKSILLTQQLLESGNASIFISQLFLQILESSFVGLHLLLLVLQDGKEKGLALANHIIRPLKRPTRSVPIAPFFDWGRLAGLVG